MIPKNLVPNSTFNCSENSAKLFHGNSAGNIVPESRSMAIPRINIYYFENSGNGKVQGYLFNKSWRSWAESKQITLIKRFTFLLNDDFAKKCPSSFLPRVYTEELLLMLLLKTSDPIPINIAQLFPSLSWVVLNFPTQQWTISNVLSCSWRALSNAREFWIACPILTQKWTFKTNFF